MILRYLIFLTLSIWLAAAVAADDSLEIVVLGQARTFTQAELKTALPTHIITVADPDHAQPLTYDTFALADLLELAGPVSGGDELVFQARDGYSPTVAYAELARHAAFVAYSEHGNPDGFGLVQQGKAMVSPAPYFLLWQEGKQLGAEFPWPYQLVKIELVEFATRYPALYPRGHQSSAAELRGFMRFKTHCLRCHSINLQGGELGPELNVPKNITEYWTSDDLRAFIHDASSYHARSKMPSFADVLKPTDLDDLLAYLTLMKMHKVQ